MSLKWILFNVSTFFEFILSAYLRSKRDESQCFHPYAHRRIDPIPSAAKAIFQGFWLILMAVEINRSSIEGDLIAVDPENRAD